MAVTPARHLAHVTLDTGHRRRSGRDEVADVAVAAVQDGLGRAIAAPRTHVAVPARDGWSYTATPYGRCLMATLWLRVEPHGDAPVLTFGVAAHSRCGPRLWRELHQPRTQVAWPYATAGQACPPEPWIAARMEIGAVAAAQPEDMRWIPDFERVIGWAWISRVAGRAATEVTDG